MVKNLERYVGREVNLIIGNENYRGQFALTKFYRSNVFFYPATIRSYSFITGDGKEIEVTSRRIRTDDSRKFFTLKPKLSMIH